MFISDYKRLGSLYNACDRGRIGRFGGCGLEVLLWRARRAPRHFINDNVATDAFDFLRVLANAGRPQFGIGAKQILIGRFTDENAAATGQAFEPAGEIHFTPKHRVVLLLGARAHQADSRHAAVDARAEQENITKLHAIFAAKKLEGVPRPVGNFTSMGAVVTEKIGGMPFQSIVMKGALLPDHCAAKDPNWRQVSRPDY